MYDLKSLINDIGIFVAQIRRKSVSRQTRLSEHIKTWLLIIMSIYRIIKVIYGVEYHTGIISWTQ